MLQLFRFDDSGFSTEGVQERIDQDIDDFAFRNNMKPINITYIGNNLLLVLFSKESD